MHKDVEVIWDVRSMMEREPTNTAVEVLVVLLLLLILPAQASYVSLR